MQGLLRKSQSSDLSGCCSGPVDFVQSYGMQCESENPLFGIPLGFFSQKISAKSVTSTVKDFIGYFGYEKAVSRQVDLKYVDRLLLDTEEGCT